ncbi:transposase [Streptomyces aquilus]|uniref:transposase n=1 Tax=Streptomyces aquilus TaxID=2548456 RepID=UPI0037D8D984
MRQGPAALALSVRPDTGSRHLEAAGPPYPAPDRGDQRPRQADNRSDPSENSGPARCPRRRPGQRGGRTSPVEATSGETQRRRLNRGGDRQANAALYRIVLSRLRRAGPSQDHLRRRLAEGKTKCEIITPFDIHRGINAVSEAFLAKWATGVTQ